MFACNSINKMMLLLLELVREKEEVYLLSKLGMKMRTCEAGTKSASSDPFHLMRNKSSPEESVAPIIRSA